MKNKLLILSMLLLSVITFAATPTDKQIDTIQNSTGGSILSVPGTGTTLVTDTNSVTLTNKTISGSANTLSNISTSSLASGFTLSVGQGGTGGITLTQNGVLFGNGTSAVGITAAGSQYQVFQAGASGTPTIGALQLNQSAAVSGSLAVANGGTGTTTLTANNVILGSGSSAVTFAAPTQYYSLIGNASGNPSFQQVSLTQGVVNTLPVSNGGLGAATETQYGLLMGNGTSAITTVGPNSNSGYVLTSTGATSAPTFQALPSSSPSVNNSAASPQSVTAAGGITLSTPTYLNLVFIKGSASGNQMVTATPSITACTLAGQTLTIISEDATHTITLQNNADLPGSQLLLNGPWTSGENNSSPNVINLICDGAATPEWVEYSRNN
jgi:hypothetical protein